MEARPDPDWPRVAPQANGRLDLTFDPPPSGAAHVDWLRVRDWLIAHVGARFHRAYEYPTFEWLAALEADSPGGRIEAELWWSDYPDELTLSSRTDIGDDFIRGVAAGLRETHADLGDLSTMDRAAWRAWMRSLGSPAY